MRHRLFLPRDKSGARRRLCDTCAARQTRSLLRFLPPKPRPCWDGRSIRARRTPIEAESDYSNRQSQEPSKTIEQVSPRSYCKKTGWKVSQFVERRVDVPPQYLLPVPPPRTGTSGREHVGTSKQYTADI